MPSELLPISACFIAGSEERDLPEAIRSIDFVKEIVVVIDARCQDRTEAAAAGAALPAQNLRILKRAWSGHVDQKNFATEQASCPWVLCLDADERVSPELSRELRELFAGGEPALSGYSVPRRNFYLGRWIRHGGWYPDRKVRLFRKDRGRWGGVNPHDRVELAGPGGKLQGDLWHSPYRGLTEHLEKMDQYTAVAATKMHEAGVRLAVLKMLTHPAWKFLRMYLLRLGCLDGFPGLAVALLGSFYVFLKYAKLWELRKLERLARSHGAVPVKTPEPPGG
ncbi:MAG: glycosyltransferase family 2 protein [Planctomycetes bacterium]|nr:glycosyltransferase family 2 protein [Planctomycetota bacterium]